MKELELTAEERAFLLAAIATALDILEREDPRRPIGERLYEKCLKALPPVA